MSYRAVEKRLNVQLGFLRLLIGSLTTRTYQQRHQLATNTFCQPTTLLWNLEALTRLQARSVLKIFTPNVTRKKNTFSLMTQPNANSFTLTKIATYSPSKTSLQITMAPRLFTSIPTPPIEKMKPQNQESRVKGQIFPTWAVSEAKQILATHLAPLGPKIGSHQLRRSQYMPSFD